MRLDLFFHVAVLLFVFASASNGCGLYKTDCMGDRKSKMEFIVTESEEGDIIMITKHEFIYTDEACSSAISFEVSSNYSLVQKSTSGEDHYFDLTTLAQIITFNDRTYLESHNCNDVIKVNVDYSATSSIFDTSCTETFDDYRDLSRLENVRIRIVPEETLSFPSLYEYPTEVYYSSSYQNSLGCVQKTSGTNWFLILIILVLICIILGLIYYQRNYRYIPITERKRIDVPKEVA